MKKKLLLFFPFIFFILLSLQGFAQGCVAIKNMPCTALHGFENGVGPDSLIGSHPQWEISLNTPFLQVV